MQIVQLVFSILILLLASLVIVPAPENHIWKMAILATECGHYLFFIPLMLISFTRKRGNAGKATAVILIISACLFLYPASCSFVIGKNIPTDLNRSFGGNESMQKSQLPNLIHLIIPYKTDSLLPLAIKVGKDSLPMDIFSDKQAIAHPLLIVIHGGAWSSGDNKGFSDQNKYLAERGYVVASVSYRLAPKFHSPIQVLDVIESLHFLKRNHGIYNLDTNNIFILGRSAGGQIALQVAYTHLREKVKGVIAIYTPADIVWGYANPGNPLILDSRKVLSAYMGGTYAEAKKNFHASNPVEWVTDKAPPTLMIHGKRDEMVAYEHNARLIVELKKHHIPFYLHALPWATHGCDYFFSGPSGQLSTYTIEYFLNRFKQQ